MIRTGHRYHQSIFSLVHSQPQRKRPLRVSARTARVRGDVFDFFSRPQRARGGRREAEGFRRLIDKKWELVQGVPR
jgi:hypothetical protein